MLNIHQGMNIHALAKQSWNIYSKYIYVVVLIDQFFLCVCVCVCYKIKRGREIDGSGTCISKTVMEVKAKQGCSHAGLAIYSRCHSGFDDRKGIRA